MGSTNHSEPVLVGLVSTSDYPHCVGLYKNMIIDPVDPIAHARTIQNFDDICGGKRKYLGMAWALVLKRKKRRVYPVVSYDYGSTGACESAMSAIKKGLYRHGLEGVYDAIHMSAPSCLRKWGHSPTKFVEHILERRIQKILCCEYEVSYTQRAGEDKNIGEHDMVIAQHSATEFVALNKGTVAATGELPSPAWTQNLGWAAIINRKVAEE